MKNMRIGTELEVGARKGSAYERLGLRMAGSASTTTGVRTKHGVIVRKARALVNERIIKFQSVYKDWWVSG
jgi:hypothetical protein